MAATGTAVAPVANQAAMEQRIRLQGRMRSGAGWLMAVALFSVINSALVLFDAKLHFIVGLGVTQLADGVGKVGGAAGSIAGFIVSLCAAGVFLLFWKFAREGQQWAFLAGMSLYALDGLIFLSFGLMLDFGFHVFALYSMYKGLSALNALNKLDSQPGFSVSQTISQ